MMRNWQEVPYEAFAREIERLAESYGFDAWVRCDDGMCQKLHQEGVSPRDVLAMYWELPRPTPLDAARLHLAAVYVASDSYRGRKLLIREPLGVVIEAAADEWLAVVEMDGQAFPGGLGGRVPKAHLGAFEVLYESRMELADYEKAQI